MFYFIVHGYIELRSKTIILRIPRIRVVSASKILNCRWDNSFWLKGKFMIFECTLLNILRGVLVKSIVLGGFWAPTGAEPPLLNMFLKTPLEKFLNTPLTFLIGTSPVLNWYYRNLRIIGHTYLCDIPLNSNY